MVVDWPQLVVNHIVGPSCRKDEQYIYKMLTGPGAVLAAGSRRKALEQERLWARERRADALAARQSFNIIWRGLAKLNWATTSLHFPLSLSPHPPVPGVRAWCRLRWGFQCWRSGVGFVMPVWGGFMCSVKSWDVFDVFKLINVSLRINPRTSRCLSFKKPATSYWIIERRGQEI